MQTKTKIPFFTDTVKKLTLMNILIFFLVLILFNVLLISFVYYILHKNLDQRIAHEIENITKTLSITSHSVSVIDSSELKESDLFGLTENPYFLQIYDRDGILLLKSRNVNLYKPIPFNSQESFDQLVFSSFSFNNENFRVGYLPLVDSNNNQFATLQLSVFEKDFKTVKDELLLFNLWGILILVLVVITGSVIISKKTFKPINTIIDTANLYNVQTLTNRITIEAKAFDEIGRLRDTLNGLFDRIENYVTEINNFSDHVSHQLMNPLTAIRTEIEYLLKRDRPENEYRTALVQLEGQTESMISIVKTLLVIAKSGKLKSESKSIFSLTKLIKNDIYKFFKDHQINYEIDENLYLRGESEKYLMVLQNIIHNSIKYSPDGVNVSVSAKKMSNVIIISIEDNGIGIDDNEKENVFRKFYRSDKVEKLGIKGFGLGLSLVKSIIDEASGTIEILDNKPTGTIFRSSLPSIDFSD